MDVPGYPLIFEMNTGDTVLVERSYLGDKISKPLVVKNVRVLNEHNNWFPDSLGRRNFYQAEVDIELAGKAHTLLLRPYQMPVTVDGLRIYVEAVREMEEIANLDPLELDKDVRLSVCLANEPWGVPGELEFPLNGYRYRSGSYNNTWSSLVPFNLLYYHRGEDLGAIPGRLDVCAWTAARVIQSPLDPGSTNGSNGIQIEAPNGIVFGYYHCDRENIDSSIVSGAIVNKGQHIARTGMTWDGRKSQHYDPHLHTEMKYGERKISLFPYFIEAYFRKYDDRALALAGGYRFADVGDTLELDATRSICRDGETIESYRWKLHDGRTSDRPVVAVAYDTSGYYSEELVVESASGAIDKDFLQVRVNAPGMTRDVGRGWAYYSPLRDIEPGSPVLFWNRLLGVKDGAEVVIDFGDGTPERKMGEEIEHAFENSGNYTVTLSSTGVDDAPIFVKLEVVVE